MLSPGVSVTVTDESFYIPIAAPTVPLIFIATEHAKKQMNGVSTAQGTIEHSVVRTVTSLSQSMQLYGIPKFRQDAAGNEMHGDARNEYGLLALNNAFGALNRAYVVRANIDLGDREEVYTCLGTPAIDNLEVVNENGEIGLFPLYPSTGNGYIHRLHLKNEFFRAQKITVKFTTPTTFAVIGSIAGHIGTGSTDRLFNSKEIQFRVNAGTAAFTPGDTFEIDVHYTGKADLNNVGVGELRNIISFIPQGNREYTVTFEDATNFIVTSDTGDMDRGEINKPFEGTFLGFTVFHSIDDTKFEAGDKFTVTITDVTVETPLGINDEARRVAVVTALQAEINSNTEVRSDIYEYNLILCPGYHECVDEMIKLATDVREEAFVIADTPCDKNPDQIAIWANTSQRKNHNACAYYYPWPMMSNLDGRNVLGAPSGIALRTYAYSDKVSYVWFAPAGANRGVVQGADSFGHVTGELGTATTFIEVNLNEGQRDNLYEHYKNINPIAFFPGRGYLVFGQKTSSPVASALDRVNVSRLVVYLRRVLRKGALPFLFEPNDDLTRKNLKAMADGLLSDILTKRGLYDYVSKCDESNNTPERIDNNYLYLDIALKPTKAVEFIAIPIRIVSTGADIN